MPKVDSLSELDAALSNAEVANQHQFFLIDNIYYTSNQYHTSDETTLFTDLLDYNNADKTTLEIEYLRVYQADEHRDIVTPDTEAFNNGNHFGY